jgi:hypothetical protein
VKRKTLNRAFSLLSLPVVLLINTITFEPALAQPTLVKQETIIAQVFPSWSRVPIDEFISVMFPGNWHYSETGIESIFNGTYYLVVQESFDAEVTELDGANICDIMNCKTMMTLAAQEFAKEGDLVLTDVRPVSVTLQGYPIDVIEFRGNHSSEPMQMKGRIFIIGNNMYFLAAGTDSSYFDNNVDIFLESFSI